MSVGTAMLKEMQFAVVDDIYFVAKGGILGLGFNTSEGTPGTALNYSYPDFLDRLYSDRQVSKRAFGIYLDNQGSSGTLILGGHKLPSTEEPSATFDIVSAGNDARLDVPLAGMYLHGTDPTKEIWSWTAADEKAPRGYVPVLLDTGVMDSYIPSGAHKQLRKILETRWTTEGLVPTEPLFHGGRSSWSGIMNCGYGSWKMTGECTHKHLANSSRLIRLVAVVFEFAAKGQNIRIPVPFSELVVPWNKHCQDDSCRDESCRFALQPSSKDISLQASWMQLGNSVLGSMHMGVDYHANTILITKAQHKRDQIVGGGGGGHIHDRSEL